MNVERLETLAAALDRVHPKGFYFGTVLSTFLPKDRWDQFPEILEQHLQGIEPNPECGTTACAVGFFPAIWPQDWHFEENIVCRSWLRDKSLRERWWTHAMTAEFFGISEEQSVKLFEVHDYPDRGDTPASEVAAKIRRLIADHQTVS